MMHFSPDPNDLQYTDAIIVNTYMKWNDVENWSGTTVENRGEEYRAFKQESAEKMLGILERDFPGIRNSVRDYYTSTPLTYRDYTGTWEGIGLRDFERLQ